MKGYVHVFNWNTFSRTFFWKKTAQVNLNDCLRTASVFYPLIGASFVLFPENLNRNLIRNSGCINQISALLRLWSGSHGVHVHALIETDSRRQPQTHQWKVWVPPLLTDVIPLNSNDDKSIRVTECPRWHKLKNLEGSFILCGGQWEWRERHNLLSKHWLVNNGQKW